MFLISSQHLYPPCHPHHSPPSISTSNLLLNLHLAPSVPILSISFHCPSTYHPTTLYPKSASHPAPRVSICQSLSPLLGPHISQPTSLYRLPFLRIFSPGAALRPGTLTICFPAPMLIGQLRFSDRIYLH